MIGQGNPTQYLDMALYGLKVQVKDLQYNIIAQNF